MLSSLVLCVTLAAHAAELRVEGEIPFQLSLNGVTAAKLYGAGELTLRGLPAGDARVRVDHGDGKIAEATITLRDDRATLLIVSTVGVFFTDAPVAVADATKTGPGEVELRLGGTVSAEVKLGESWHTVKPDVPLVLKGLPPGRYPLEVRSANRSVIWSRAELEVGAQDHLVVVLAEGRALHVFGRPAAASALIPPLAPSLTPEATGP
ncbi:MAG: hypothetical protein IPO67_30820 [Deltaproteobacteria bacterium]|nr:hypothetical protein [Deltaproteobacteria bacterium]